MLDSQKKETYQKWKSLVNMSKSELEKFYNSPEGKVAGLTASQAKKAGIDSGRESARWIMRMKDTPVSEWTATMWKWAKKQISFISRMSGMKGDLYDNKGRKTRKHTSLLIWGHNPKKYELGGTLDLLAPNGEPSNLTPEQYKLVRTPEFKAWFGDWENDPANASKVVDENGEPMVVYHGTNKIFYEFKRNKSIRGGFAGEREVLSQAYFFTDNIDYAKKAASVRVQNEYGSKMNILSVFLNSKNVLNLSKLTYETEVVFKKLTGYYPHEYFGYDDNLDQWWRLLDDEENIVEKIKELGCDSVMLAEKTEDNINASIVSIGVFNSEQIKLADGTNTAFDASNPDIRYKDGGRTVAQTPAPKSERIKGSSVNKEDSSKDTKTAKAIKFDVKTLLAIKNKVDEHNKAYPQKKITLAAAKAVVRRGMGAYSSSHRPTIKGGKPNSRTAWGLARLNAFIYKAINGKSKSGKYTQDDDLLEGLGISHKKFENGGSIENSNKNKESIERAKQIALERNDAFGKFFYENIDIALIEAAEQANSSESEKRGAIKFYGEEFVKIAVQLHPEKKPNSNLTFKNGGETGLLAPNGKPSNLTPEQYKLVRTTEFKAWFGDWERLEMAKIKDPSIDVVTLENLSKDVSKVVDENGEPMVVYHGTASNFNEFKVGMTGGIFFSNNKSSAERFSTGDLKRLGENPKIIECFLNIKKYYDKKTNDEQLIDEYYTKYFQDRPFIKKSSQKNILKDKYKKYFMDLVSFGIVNEEPKQILISYNYDGILIDADNNSKSYIVFKPNQIKLSNGMNTMFDVGNPDIRFDDGGIITKDKIKITGFSKYTKSNKSGSFYRVFAIRQLSDGESEMWWIAFKIKNAEKTVSWVRYGYHNNKNEDDEIRQEKLISIQELPKSILDVYNDFGIESKKIDIRFKDGGEVKKPTMFFWHGGNLDEYDDIIAQKGGRYEYGAGLYLTTKWDVAAKYAKGSRKMYKVEVETGVDINDSYLPMQTFYDFIKNYVITSKRKEIKERIDKYNKEGKARAYIFNNIILNEKAIKSTNSSKLREFYVENGIDYEIVNNPFGWGEDMMVLYNMKKIVGTQVISPKEKIEDYDLKPINDKRMKDFNEGYFADGGSLSYSEYKKSQFNEEEDSYLPSDYFEEFQIRNNEKINYPILLKNAQGIEYRLKSEKSNTIGAFDNEKLIGYADNKAVEVSPIYHKKGIGLQLISLIKERNPNHRFGSMTPQGFSLMGSYYDKVVSQNFADGGETNIMMEKLNTYQKRISANMQAMQTEIADWRAVPIIGKQETENDKGFTVEMPLFDFPKNYKPAPSIFKMSYGQEPMNCELCGKVGIKNLFYIQNDKKEWVMSVGSECVTHFGEGKSGKEKLREAKLRLAEMMDTDLINLKSIIKDTFSKVVYIGYGKNERKWNVSFVDKNNQQTGQYWDNFKAYFSTVEPSLVFDKKDFYKENIKWNFVYNSIPVYGILNYYSLISPVSGKNQYGETKETIEKNILTWFKRNEETGKKILQQLPKLIEISSDKKIDFKSEYIESFNHGETEIKFDELDNNQEFKTGGMTGQLKETKTVSQVAAKHNISTTELMPELINGIKVEMEHTNDPETAKQIALDHLDESPKYYEALREMEEQLKVGNIDDYYGRIKKRFANGGAVDAIYSFKTPTGEPSRLSYIQQVLVRTKGFKDFFGDWEMAAKKFIQDGRENFQYHYKSVSKVLNMVTLEPLVVYHGTRTEQEFFEFDVTRKEGVGRPYAYFADNVEYATNFTKQSQRGANYGKSYLYEVFLNIRKPFFALGEKIEQKYKNDDYWVAIVAKNLFYDRFDKDFNGEVATVEEREQMANILIEVTSQIGDYAKSVYGDSEYPFWRMMAGDVDKKFKTMLMLNKFDGVRYGEEFQSLYDPNDPAQYTRAWVIFDALQVKLADGRNITFDPFNIDIRMEKGGTIDNPEAKSEVKSEVQMDKFQSMKAAMGIEDEKFADGGTVYGDGTATKDAKDGGFFKGKSHADGGIKAVNKDTGQIIEVEGNEVIINKRSVADGTKREFEGEMLTNREILSRINQSGGGVAFADGGELGGNCGCTGKKYKFGGETLEDFLILNKLNGLSETIKTPIEQAREYVDDLLNRINS